MKKNVEDEYKKLLMRSFYFNLLFIRNNEVDNF